jgi:nucleotide-binding universal stress UspA family protein
MITATIKRILVTTDLSSDAVKAYPYAASMAKQFGADLTLLSCIDTSVGYSPSGVGSLEAPSLYVAETVEELRKTVAHDLQKHTQEYFAEIPSTQEIREAPYEVQHSILTFIQDNTFDLVIMASHGRSGITRALLGSVTEYIIRHCKTPVLVVPTSVAA